MPKASRSCTLSWALLCAIILLTIAGYALTLREGQDWGGDFAMYVHHAINIVEGKPYADTGYIYNPSYPSLGPSTYPPIYPVALAPLYRVFGLDYTAFKLENILFFVAALVVLYLTFRETLPDYARLAAVVLVAANPYLWAHRERVLSEFLFLLLALVALYSIDRVYRRRPGQPPPLRDALFVGGLCYLAYGTRSVGVLLIPALLVHDIALYRKPSRFALAATAIFAVLAGLQSLLVPGMGTYLDQFATVTNWPALLANHAVECLRGFGLYFLDVQHPSHAIVLGSAVGVLAIVGCAVRARRQLGVYEAFFALYVVTIIAWPVASYPRYLITIFPLALLYAAAGVLALRSLVPGFVVGGAAFLLLLAILLPYANYYPQAPTEPISGVESQRSADLFAFIRQETPEDAVLVFRKPRPLSLYTGRAASVYHRPADDQELWDYMRAIDADYVIVGDEFADDRNYLEPFVRRYEDRFTQVYAKNHFAVYSVSLAP